MNDTGQIRIREKQEEDVARKIDKTTLQKERQEHQKKNAFKKDMY